jgi:hypothetical protein
MGHGAVYRLTFCAIGMWRLPMHAPCAPNWQSPHPRRERMQSTGGGSASRLPPSKAPEEAAAKSCVCRCRSGSGRMLPGAGGGEVRDAVQEVAAGGSLCPRMCR